ncbi:MAG: efflux RND transporter periplasmic adaptor subunit, partial [Gammaproteobacteria bacterium]
ATIWISIAFAQKHNQDKISKAGQKPKCPPPAYVLVEKAKFDLHSKEVKRFTELLKHNNVARSQLDQAISDQAVAKSNMASAKARLSQAEERLRRTRIVAPFDGVVSERLLQTGEWADRGSTIVRLVSSNNLEIQTHIPASSLQFITIGMPLTYINGAKSSIGKVRALVPIGGDNSRLYELRITSEDESLVSGKLLRVAIPTEHEREAILVPRDALVLRREGVYVFRVIEGPEGKSVAERIQIETGIADLNRIEVIGKIQAGDFVITRGGENLRPGMAVSVKPLQAGS